MIPVARESERFGALVKMGLQGSKHKFQTTQDLQTYNELGEEIELKNAVARLPKK